MTMFSFVVAVHVDKCHRLTFRLEICFDLEMGNKCIVLCNTLLGSEPQLMTPGLEHSAFGSFFF